MVPALQKENEISEIYKIKRFKDKINDYDTFQKLVDIELGKLLHIRNVYYINVMFV